MIYYLPVNARINGKYFTTVFYPNGNSVAIEVEVGKTYLTKRGSFSIALKFPKDHPDSIAYFEVESDDLNIDQIKKIKILKLIK